MRAHWIFLAAVLLSPAAWAATLVSDYQAYSADGTDYNSPDAFEWSVDGGTTWEDIAVEVAGDGVMFRVAQPFDIASQGDWLIRAKNTYWDRVSVAVPFTWGGEGTLPAPSGFRIIP